MSNLYELTERAEAWARIRFVRRAVLAWAAMLILALAPIAAALISHPEPLPVFPFVFLAGLLVSSSLFIAGSQARQFWARKTLAPLLVGTAAMYCSLALSGIITFLLFRPPFVAAFGAIGGDSYILYGSAALWGYGLDRYRDFMKRRLARLLSAHLSERCKASLEAGIHVSGSMDRLRRLHRVTFVSLLFFLTGLFIAAVPFAHDSPIRAVGAFAFVAGMLGLMVRAVWFIAGKILRRSSSSARAIEGRLAPCSLPGLWKADLRIGGGSWKLLYAELALMRLLPGAYEHECEELAVSCAASKSVEADGTWHLSFILPSQRTDDLAHLSYVLRLQAHGQGTRWGTKQSIRLALPIASAVHP